MSFYTDNLSPENRKVITDVYRPLILDLTRHLGCKYSAPEIFSAIKRRRPNALLDDVCVALVDMHEAGELDHDRLCVQGVCVSVFSQGYRKFLMSSEIDRAAKAVG